MYDLSFLDEFKQAAQATKFFALDVEATSLDKRTAQLDCISLAVKDKTWFVPLRQFPNALPLITVRDWFNDNIFNDPELTLIGHNLKYDIAVLRNHGFVVLCKLIDTMIGEWVCNEVGAAPPTADHGSFGLKELVKKYFNEERKTFAEVESFRFLDPARFEEYARMDARDAWRLWFDIISPNIERQGPKIRRLFFELEMPILRVIMEMEESGLFIDIERMEKLIVDVERRVAELSAEIFKIAGKTFNISSGEQLSDVLFSPKADGGGGGLGLDPGDIPLMKKSTPNHPIYSTDKGHIKKLRKAHKIIPLIEEYRKSTKLRDGFLKPFLKMALSSDSHRIYPEFKQTGTRIGRLSSENPNSQNMPRKGGVRDCVVAPPGKLLICGDLNQIELRILAHVSKDPDIINAYLKGSDLHKLVMEECGVERTLAKNINFGILYGFSVPSLAEFISVTQKRAREINDKWAARFKRVPDYREKVKWAVTKNGFVETVFGRRRRFAGVPLDAYAHRQAFHFTISGSAADCIKIGMVKLHRALEERRKSDLRYRGVRMLAQVHDELLLEAPEEIAEDVRVLVKSCMEDVGRGGLRVPIKAEVGKGKTWTEAKA